MTSFADVFEFFFYGVCEWVGRKFIGVMTLGRVDLDERDGFQMVISSLVGVAVLTGVGVLLAVVLGWF